MRCHGFKLIRDQQNHDTDTRTTYDMKIYFGHQANEKAKISSALLDRGVHLFRASPGEIHAVGLFRYQQPGFLSYMMALPAFIHANETKKTTPIAPRGYPLAIKQDDLMPLDFPKTFIKAKKGKKLVYKGDHEEFMARADGTTYLANFDKALLGLQVNSQVDKTAYSPSPFVRLCDVPAMITIARLLSSFLRVHRYPAFADEEHLAELTPMAFNSKHNLEPEDDLMAGNKKRISEVVGKEGVIQGTIVKDNTVTDGKLTHKIDFHVAKPGNATNLAWGSPSEIPTTHGIHFPYLDELSKLDKDTVPRVIEKFFIRSLGRNTEECLRNYSDVVQAWKTSICSTLWGRQLSHIFRVIEIALPAQARPFPIIDSGVYCGTYLSGAGFSVGMGKTVLRPDSYKANFMELACYGTNETIIEEIAAALGIESDDKDLPGFRKIAKKGVRALAEWIQDNKSLSTEDQRVVAKLCLQMRTTTPYRVPNVAGILWAVNGIKSGAAPLDTEPMYPLSLFRTDIFSLYFSAFGPLSPSPEMPGGSLMKFGTLGKLPDGFNKVLAMRLVSLEQSVSDWKKVLREGCMHNGFANLSAPYEYSTITGKDAKENWFACLAEFSKWYKAQELKSDGALNVEKPTEGEEVDWDVLEEGFDFEGF